MKNVILFMLFMIVFMSDYLYGSKGGGLTIDFKKEVNITEFLSEETKELRRKSEEMAKISDNYFRKMKNGNVSEQYHIEVKLEIKKYLHFASKELNRIHKLELDDTLLGVERIKAISHKEDILKIYDLTYEIYESFYNYLNTGDKMHLREIEYLKIKFEEHYYHLNQKEI